MELNEDKLIRKYQVGGSIYQPIPLMPTSAAPGIPASAAPEDSKSKGSGNDDDDGPLSKKVMEKLLGEGLVNEVMAFSQEINKAYSMYNSLSDFEKNTSFGQELRRTMKGDIGTVTQMLRNRQNFEDGIKQVKDQGAYSDFAITAGGVIVKDMESGRVGEMSTEAFTEAAKSGKYKILTNSELAKEREYNPQLINNVKSLDALTYAIGSKTVKNEISEILSNLGSTDKEKSLAAYQLHGAAQQLAGAAAQGVYKIEEMAGNSNNFQQLKMAQTAMWNHLSPNAKSLLKARAAAMGVGADNLDEAAKELAVQVIASKATSKDSSTSNITYDSSQTQDLLYGPGGKPKTGDEKYEEVGDMETLARGSGIVNPIEIMNGSDKMTLYGHTIGALRSSDGKIYGKGAMYGDMAGIPALVDSQNMSIGGVKIKDPNAVMYSGEEAASVWAPVKNDGTPDFEAAKKLNPIKQRVAEMNRSGQPKATIEAYVRSQGAVLKPSGDVTMPNFKKFWVFNGSIHEDALAGKDRTFLKKEDSVEEKMYNAIYMYGNAESEGEVLARAKKTHTGILMNDWTRPDVYRGQIYVEAKEAGAAARSYDRNRILMDKQKATADHQFTNGGRGRVTDYNANFGATQPAKYTLEN